MLQLLQPIWLWASTGIIVPILIHLWHNKQGKTLKVGSIIFLQQSSKQQSSSLKITDWLLLLLRCLLIILLTILLAKPQWQQSLQGDKQKGWLLISNIDFSKTYQHFKPTIDSLLKKDYELHSCAPGFELMILKDSVELASNKLNVAISYWQLTKQLNEQVTGSKPIYLFTNNQLQNFTGNKYEGNKPIKWLTYTPKDSIKVWLHTAYKSTNDSIKIGIKKSTTSATNITFETIAYKNGKQANYTINKLNNSINLNGKDPILIDTSKFLVKIFSNKYGVDATYIKAAVDAVQQFTKKQISCTIISNPSKLSQNDNLVFWLSDKPLQKLDKKTKIIQYVTGKILDSLTWLSHIETTISRAVITNNKNNIIWQDGFGNPLLSIDDNTPNLYYLHTHFNPSWNDLVWQENFPKLILSILLEDYQIHNPIVNNDKRIIDQQQLSTSNGNISNDKNDYIQYSLKDITPIVWLLVLIIFFFERLLSLKSYKPITDGR